MSIVASSAFSRRQVCGGAPLLASVGGVPRPAEKGLAR